ncbi:MAG TPA: hypothetical protein PKM41_02515 [Deltaproteobacteria bacterium]|jgi:hypothetical protein|nr:hypothetical protein [Deltaproteobacteria bacterium]HOI05885.1 hypothetical protein [Deltaproteobacteria bacterium]
MDSGPRITFDTNGLNSEPFIRYPIGQLYPFAHQIFAVGGATPIATPCGHIRRSKLHDSRNHSGKLAYTSLIADGIEPGVVLKTISAIRKLNKKGYCTFSISPSHAEYSFILKGSIRP